MARTYYATRIEAENTSVPARPAVLVFVGVRVGVGVDE